jgi:putative membrane protein
VIRLAISLGIQLLASAVALVVAALVLDDMGLDATGLVTGAVVFTLVVAVSTPLIKSVAFRHANVLLGSSALVASLAGLVVATWVADGLRISGVLTWVMATVIVWAAALLAGLLLPVLLVKRAVQGGPGPDVTDWGRSRRRAPRGSGGLR